MAFLFCDSFDHYATADITTKWTTSSAYLTTATINSSAGRRSTSGYRIVIGTFAAGATAGLTKTLSTTGAGFVAGFYFKSTNTPYSSYLCGFYESSTAHVFLRMNADYTVSALRGDGTVLGTSTPTGASNGVGVYLEIKGTIDNSTGSVTIKANQSTILTLTSVDTQNGGTSTWNVFSLGHLNTVNTGAAGITYDFDDLYVLDQSGSSSNDFWGDVRVDALLPSGAGTTANFTPSTGSNYQNVDDATPDGDSTYNSTSSVGNLDTFAMPDAPVSGASIRGVQHCIYAKKGDAGTCTIGAVVRHSGTDYASSALSPTTSYAYLLVPQDQNPGTSAAWTESGWNAAECGYKKVS